MKIFSIIIPVYNGQNVIGRALDSIYSQGMTDDSFEVICVDDCSPTMEAFEVINDYTYAGIHPANLKILRHETNKRQGGARNTGLNHAEGEWILYLDQDDSFVENSLQKLLKEFHESIDVGMLVFDSLTIDIRFHSSASSEAYHDDSIYNSEVIETSEYLKNYPVPWSPWHYAYRRSLLLEHNIKFVECVRWEDLDYVMKSLLSVDYIKRIPLTVYKYVLTGENTSIMGKDMVRIEDWMKMSVRIKDVAESFMYSKGEAANTVMNHHIYHYSTLLKRTLWRLPYGTILKLLNRYTPYEKSGNALIDFTRKHPHTYAVLAQVVRPFLLTAVWVRNKVKK